MQMTADATTLLLAALARTGEALAARLPQPGTPSFESYGCADVLAPFRDALAEVTAAAQGGALALTQDQVQGKGDLDVALLLGDSILQAKVDGREDDCHELTRLRDHILGLVHIESKLHACRTTKLDAEGRKRMGFFEEDRVSYARECREDMRALDSEIRRIASVFGLPPFALRGLRAAVNELLKAGDDLSFLLGRDRGSLPSRMLPDAEKRHAAALARFKPEP